MCPIGPVQHISTCKRELNDLHIHKKCYEITKFGVLFVGPGTALRRIPWQVKSHFYAQRCLFTFIFSLHDFLYFKWKSSQTAFDCYELAYSYFSCGWQWSIYHFVYSPNGNGYLIAWQIAIRWSINCQTKYTDKFAISAFKLSDIKLPFREYRR